jgi:hypothetical protein
VSRALVSFGVLLFAVALVAARPHFVSGVSTADIERAVYAGLQARGPVSDVRCSRTGDDAARCIAIFPDGTRARLAASVDERTGRVTWAEG